MHGETALGAGPAPSTTTRRKTTRTRMDRMRRSACHASSADPYRRSSCLAAMAEEGLMGRRVKDSSRQQQGTGIEENWGATCLPPTRVAGSEQMSTLSRPHFLVGPAGRGERCWAESELGSFSHSRQIFIYAPLWFNTQIPLYFYKTQILSLSKEKTRLELGPHTARENNVSRVTLLICYIIVLDQINIQVAVV